MDGVVAALRSGSPLLIAPEGERSHKPGMQTAKPGIAFIVEQTGLPVVPVAIVGTTDDFFHKASRGKRPQLEMHIGKPFHLPPVEGKGADPVPHAHILRVCRAIDQMVDQMAVQSANPTAAGKEAKA